MSPRLMFQKELRELSDNLHEMTDGVIESYEKLFSALAGEDQDVIGEIALSEKVFGDMQRAIEAKCLYLITKQQPIASDLRFVTASLKVVADIDRISDHVADIAELFLRMHKNNADVFKSLTVVLAEMAAVTGKMLKEAINSFFYDDEDEAAAVITMDDQVDALFNKIKEELISHLKADSKNADECIDTLMVVKHLEKIGDHAESIGLWELFRISGDMKNTRLL